MRYIMILVLVIFFIGCGGGNSEDDKNPPASPQTKDSKNIPPSVPKI